MRRSPEADLSRWISAAQRQPLVIRGARQVGKTWLVRELARAQRKELVELNLERDPSLGRAFRTNDPKTILGELEIALSREIDPATSMLFLDEVQAVPELFAKLRWFAEEMPELPLVAAGSLLELALGESTLSMPVGRIQYLHVEPMGLVEYLHAHGQRRLLRALDDWPARELSTTLHDKATEWLDRYAMVGGMPAVVALDVGGAAPRTCREAQRDLAATYRDDFAKYGARLSRDVLDAALLAVVRSLGRKLVYERVAEGIRSQHAKKALELLAAAKLCHFVTHTAANGLPLAAEAKTSMRKAILLDVGLMNAWLGTPASRVFPRWAQLAPELRAKVSEQLAGQALRLAEPASGEGPRLHYWHREGGRPGEIDYLVQIGSRILPIEVKSGSAGAMKSLHQFMADKNLRLAVRIDRNPPSWMDVDVRTTQGDRAAYELLSLPLYMLHRLAELVASRRRR